MKAFQLSHLCLIATVLAVVGCRPKPIDPPFESKAMRQDSPVDKQNFASQYPQSALVGMGVPNLWKKTTGKNTDGSRVTIALVGSGVDYTNSDLRDSLWLNVGELGLKNANDGSDNDGNKYADDVFGYDFASGDSRPYDWHGHDTITATLIASSGRSNAKLVGVAPDAQLMIARYIDAEGKGSGMDAAPAIEYAVNNGARVVYFNWPQGGFAARETKLILAQLRFAESKNVLVVIPAGNSANDDVPAFIKEAAVMSNVVVVAGVDQTGALSKSTNSGVKVATLSAPAYGEGYTVGGQIVSNLQTTSVAAAYVTAIAALLSTQPGLADVKKVREALIRLSVNSKSGEKISVLSGGTIYLGNF